MLDPSRLLIAVCLGLLVAAPAPAQDAPAADRVVRVSGEGTVRAAPDRATVRFGIVSRAETAEAARRQNAAAAKTAMNAVRKLGVAEEKMRMESLRLQPRREYDPQTQTREERGYEASRQVVVELDTLAQLPRLVTRVVQRGANRLEGIDYGLQDRTAARNDALRQAAQSARDKAQLLAESLGAALGPVRQIDEQSFGYQSPSPRVEMQLAKSAAEDAAPEPDAYAAGEIEVNATVQVTFSLQ
jgi:uncharacterized protein YggE